jgi:hypothetical protein
MRRSRIALALSAGGALLLSCDAPSRTVAPRLSPNAGPSADVGTLAVTDPLRLVVAQIWGTNPGAGAALANYDAAHKSAGAPAACAPTAALLGTTLDAFRDGRLSGKPGNDTFAKSVQQLVVGLNAYCAHVAPPTFPLAALSINGAARYLPVSGGVVATIDELAVIGVPNGALPGAALVTISRRLGAPAGTVLGTSLESGPFYDIATYPQVARLGRPVSIGMVQVGPGKAASSVDVVVGHKSTQSGTESTPVVICPSSWMLAGRFLAPSYLHPSAATGAAAIRAARPTTGPALGVVHNDSAGTAGGCGSANDLSPFGLIEVHRANFDAKPFLSAAYACATSFTISNRYSADLVAVWRAVRKTAAAATVSDPSTVLVRAGRSVTVSIGTAGPGSELRLQYGPTVVGSALLPAVQRRCS